MISLQLFLCDEMYRGIIVCKIVRHSLDLLFNLCLVSTLLSYHKTLSGVLLSGGQYRIFTIPDSFQCGFYRNGVLLGVLNPGDTADSVGMSLADTLPPKSIVTAVS